jgi:SpoVK/Ycf46/Vps4 family AAA+-type ATPase
MPLADDVEVEDLAQGTQGFTGAELAVLCRWGEWGGARGCLR